ncbi:hypothetical protein Poly30_47160 [Planctomycetes bacterium Poly30]|uniref:Virginiamycin B lyase n=1 Tax=Saltatorellus ferox TaxID=2528018 RepID=A0A518EYJ2_9BACT|nr:hypothetical protein Poly30_47160 [Planctomycetes bacterium Poly30]
MRTPSSTSLLFLSLCWAAPAAAQGLVSSLVTDTSGDTIWLCVDLNADGDYNDAGDLRPFYEDTTGSVPLTNNSGLVRSSDGAIWVTDTTEDVILRLKDSNGNGDALDPGEAGIWFDGTSGNPSGVELTSARGLWRDEDGVIWVASANTGGGGNDAIVRVEDLNMDGDANDPLEQLEFAVFAPGGAVGDSIPTAVVRGVDGKLYYTETGSSGVLAKGVYRLEDLDGSGTIDQPGESQPFFLPAALGGTPFHWDLGIDSMGRFYLEDTGNDVIWRFEDTDGNGVVDPATEAKIIYTAPASSLIWEVTPAADGSLFVVEDQTPDRLLRLIDLNGDGLFDAPGEETTIYDDSIAFNDIGSPKGIVLIEGDIPIGQSYCGPAAMNSAGTSAALLAFGSTSVAANDVTLRTEGMSLFSASLFIVSRDAGFAMNPGGSQGNLCLSGQVGRYVFSVLNSGASGSVELPIDLLSIPQPTGPTAVLVGDTWRFQVWYRDANPSATSNFTDAVAIDFIP